LSRPGWLVTYRNKVPPLGVEPRHLVPILNCKSCHYIFSLIYWWVNWDNCIYCCYL